MRPHNLCRKPTRCGGGSFRCTALSFWCLWLFFGGCGTCRLCTAQSIVEKAQISQSKVVDLEAPRGMIYDRAGTPLVRNIPNFTIAIVPIYLPGDEPDNEERMQVYQRLSSLLNMPITAASASAKLSGSEPGIKDIVDQAVKDGQYYREIPIKTGVPREIAMIIEEQKMKLPGVKLKVVGTRYYPLGSLISQIIGYVGHIPAESAAKLQGQRLRPGCGSRGADGHRGQA